MKILSRVKGKRSIIALLIFVFVGGVIYTFQSGRISIRNELFEGEYQICEKEEPTFYPRVNYKMNTYKEMNPDSESASEEESSKFATKRDAGEIAWVDGADRDAVKAAIEKHPHERKEDPALTRLRYDSCYKDRRPYQSLQLLTPEDGALFPPNLCAPYVEWEDPNNNLWQITILLEEESPLTFTVEEKRWRFPKSLWQKLCNHAIGNDIQLQIKGIQVNEKGDKTGPIQATESITFQICKDPADSFIVYRLVAPPFSSYKTPDIFVRDIHEDHSSSFLSARREYCLNCHNFSSKQGNVGKLSLQVRSLVKVANNLPTYLAIYDIEKREGFKVRLPFEIQMTTFMAWSPDGNKLAYSANQKVAAMKPIVFETQLAGMATSDIAIYDVETNETYLVPGASDPNLLEIYPQWSPDGNQLLFSRSPVGDHPAHILYDLYVMDLNEESRAIPRPIEGAAENGRSNFYPRFSPDGKWLSFCQSDGGDLIRASSDIYLKAGDLSGPAHRLEFNVDYAADSWHSWSSNSHWLVFASKREGGVYAYLYLTHIDDEGHASPAIPLPLEEKPFASYNIPEFIAHVPTIQEEELFDAIRVEPEPRTVQLREYSQRTHHEQKEEKSG